MEQTGESPLTQRSDLGLVACVFDPIGTAASFAMPIRRYSKKLLRFSHQQWACELTSETAEKNPRLDFRIADTHRNCKALGLFSMFGYRVELHYFDDSSQEVFKAVEFLLNQTTGSKE